MQTLRTAPPFYWLFGGLFGGSTLLVTFTAINNPTFWFPTAIMGVITATIMCWGRTTTLSLSNEIVRYRSLLLKTDLALADIAKATLKIGFSGYQPFQRVVFTVRGRAKGKEVVVNAGLFDGREVKQWVENLNSRLK